MVPKQEHFLDQQHSRWLWDSFVNDGRHDQKLY